MRSLIIFLIGVSPLIVAGADAPAGAPAKKPMPGGSGYEHAIEAESFDNVAEAVINDKGEPQLEPGKWTKFKGDSYSKGALVRGPCAVGEEASKTFSVPRDGTYYFWIYHGQHPSLSTAFNLYVNQDGGKNQELNYCEKFAHEKRDDKDLIYRPGYWDCWSCKPVELKKGKVYLTLSGAKKPTWAATVDVIFVTDDPEFKPSLQSDGRWDAFYLGEE
jgi:hypothetical protein